MTIHKNKGMTLIEVMIYVALLGLIMTGFLVSVYQLINSHSRTEDKIYSQEEGNFLIHKIDWAMTGASEITSPALNGQGSILTLKNGSVTLTFRLDANGHVEMQRGASAFQDLSSNDVTVTNLQFEHDDDGPGNKPARIIATFNVDGQSFKTVKYLRQ